MLFKEKFIRNIFLFSFLLILTFPLYNIFITYPSFISALKEGVKEESIKTTEHLVSMLDISDKTVQIHTDTFKDLEKDFHFIKIKFFRPDGTVTYSTDPEDIGVINKKKYFHEVVAKGEPYAKFVEKETRSLEGHLMKVDNVETYVPIMKDGKFIGAFEIYYDITDRKNLFDKLRNESTAIAIFMAIGFFIIVLISSLRISRSMEERRKIDTKHRLLLDNIHAGVVVHAPDTSIIFSNKNASDILGLTKEQLSDKTVIYTAWNFIYEDKTTMPLDEYPVNRVIASGMPIKNLLAGVKNQETDKIVWILLNAYPEFIGDSLDHITVTFIDISDHKSDHERVEKHIKHLGSLRAIDMAITASLDLRVTLKVFLGEVMKELSADASNIMLMNSHRQALEYASSEGFRSDNIKNLSLKVGESYAGKVAYERKPLIIPDLSQNPLDIKHISLITDEGFRSYCGIPLIAKGSVVGVLEIFNRHTFEPEKEWLDFFEALAGQAAIAIDNATLFNDLQNSRDEIILAYESTIEGWSRALDYRDKETEGHSQRVTDITVKIAREMGIRDTELLHIRRGALLHDIGKLGVPDCILLKPGKLSDEEWVIMKSHPDIAYKLLSPINYLRTALLIPYCHHEKWDGTGYPRGLKGEEIPVAARIFALVDVWDALNSDRPYRPAWAKDKVLDHIKSLSGTHFDPKVIESFLKMNLTK